MAYLLSDGGTAVVKYPYTLVDLRQDNPNVSFPRNPADAMLVSFNVYQVVETGVPAYNPLSEDLNEVTPVSLNGGLTWIQAWEVTQVDAAEAQARYDAAMAATAAEANRRLQDAEQYYFDALSAGYGFSTEMEAYISVLNNPSILAGYPLDIAWPNVPAQRLNPANPDLPFDIYTASQVHEVIDEVTGMNLNIDLIDSFEMSLLAGDNSPV